MSGYWRSIFRFLPLDKDCGILGEKDIIEIGNILTSYYSLESEKHRKTYQEYSDIVFAISETRPFSKETILTKKQLELIASVTDLTQRVQLGQWREIEWFLPLGNPIDCNDLNRVGHILSKYTISGVDGWGSSLGIGHKDLPWTNSVLYDIRCAIRHKLSWEEAVERGYVERETSPRNWREMMTIDYDEPMHYGSEPLLDIKRLPSEG